MIEALIRDDVEVLAMYREAMKPKRGPRQHSIVDNVNDIQTPKGNTRAYTLSRLKREEPELFQRVAAKELSANAAAIKAGKREA